MSDTRMNPKGTAETVGYGKPPKGTRFKPGKSGNPKGRPKGAKNIDTLMAEELAAPVKIREQGVEMIVSKAHAFIKMMLANAINGDMRAGSAILAWHTQKAARGQDTDEEMAAEDLEILKALQNRKVRPK